MRKLNAAMAMTLVLTGMLSVHCPVFADEETVIRTNIGSEPDSLDPWISAASDTYAVMHNVFEGLVSFDETGALLPGLAKSWEISDDGLTYTFTLRDDVTFHNGKAMTADDVVYSYETLTGLGGGEPLTSKFSSVVSVEAEDDYTVVITLEKPDSSFLQLNTIAVLPEGYEDQATAPVGTGPYTFEKYVPGQEIILKKNEDYYDEEHAGSIDKAIIRIMTDESAVLNAMQSGQLDLALVYADNAEYLNGDFTIESAPQNMVQLLALNNTEEPFDDIRVRQAINYAVNRDEIIDGVFAGYATQIYSNFSPVMGMYYNDELEDSYPYDVEKAKELLKEAGYEDGFDMMITVPSNYQKHVDTAQVIIEQLRAVGIRAKLDPIPWSSWLEDVYKGAKYQSTIVGLTGKLDPKDILIRYTDGYSKNFFHYSNEKYDELIDEASSVSPEESAELYKEAQKLLTEDAAAVYICDPHAIIVSKSNLKGYKFYPLTFLDLSSLYYE